jgi:hypothetical protein
MRIRVALLAPLALVLTACAEGPTSLDAAPGPATGPSLARDATSTDASDVARPMSGRCETTLDPAVPLAPGVIRQVDRGTCQLSHLGRSDLVSDKVIQLMTGTQTTAATFTAADGDVLRATGQGTNALTGPGRARFTATLTFVGGTGRFAGATGTVAVVGETDLVARRATLTLDGQIAYDAAASAQ